MTALSLDDQVTLAEVFLIFVGIAITWAIYYGSDRAELPGESTIPEPGQSDDMEIDNRGRSL
jgi:hypothetical protein